VGETAKKYPAVLYACGFSVWKKPIVRRFFPESNIVFLHNVSQVPSGNTLIVWGRKNTPDKLPVDVQIIYLEDGFLRSVGLGADLVQPVSWVIDGRGIYYDATQPSDLEVLLQATEFTSELLVRAAHFRERIVSAGLTKYNVGSHSWHRPSGVEHVILVPGQVESDASIRFGAPNICANLGLLRAVREANPNAYLLYKPHPDVVAGLRRQGQHEDESKSWCDEIIVDAAMGDLLQQVDEVHTLTSLTGFEALMRNKKVTCYGQPFYAGWGLTSDVVPIVRRSRQLSLDMLVAGALILYPTYISRVTGKLITAELALNELLAWRAEEGGLPWWNSVYRFVVGKILGRI
jgi:capsular polysaccharide export protein